MNKNLNKLLLLPVATFTINNISDVGAMETNQPLNQTLTYMQQVVADDQYLNKWMNNAYKFNDLKDTKNPNKAQEARDKAVRDLGTALERVTTLQKIPLQNVLFQNIKQELESRDWQKLSGDYVVGRLCTGLGNDRSHLFLDKHNPRLNDMNTPSNINITNNMNNPSNMNNPGNMNMQNNNYSSSMNYNKGNAISFNGNMIPFPTNQQNNFLQNQQNNFLQNNNVSEVIDDNMSAHGDSDPITVIPVEDDLIKKLMSSDQLTEFQRAFVRFCMGQNRSYSIDDLLGRVKEISLMSGLLANVLHEALKAQKNNCDALSQENQTLRNQMSNLINNQNPTNNSNIVVQQSNNQNQGGSMNNAVQQSQFGNSNQMNNNMTNNAILQNQFAPQNQMNNNMTNNAMSQNQFNNQNQMGNSINNVVQQNQLGNKMLTSGIFRTNIFSSPNLPIDNSLQVNSGGPQFQQNYNTNQGGGMNHGTMMQGQFNNNQNQMSNSMSTAVPQNQINTQNQMNSGIFGSQIFSSPNLPINNALQVNSGGQQFQQKYNTNQGGSMNHGTMMQGQFNNNQNLSYSMNTSAQQVPQQTITRQDIQNTVKENNFVASIINAAYQFPKTTEGEAGRVKAQNDLGNALYIVYCQQGGKNPKEVLCKEIASALKTNAFQKQSGSYVFGRLITILNLAEFSNQPLLGK